MIAVIGRALICGACCGGIVAAYRWDTHSHYFHADLTCAVILALIGIALITLATILDEARA